MASIKTIENKMAQINIDLFKEFLASDLTIKAFAESKKIPYSLMIKLINKSENLFTGKIVPVEDYFPEHVSAYRLKYSWAREPDYVHRPPTSTPVADRKKWLLFIAAHEDIYSNQKPLGKDLRKVSDITVYELLTIIQSIMYNQ